MNAGKYADYSRVALIGTGLFACLNCVFIGISCLAFSLPVEPIRGHIELALHRGDILTDPATFPDLDSARGIEPFGDSNTMLMAIHRGDAPLAAAISPKRPLTADGRVRHPAQELHGAVFKSIAFDPHSGEYNRYWHGNVAVTSFLLTTFDVRQARLLLMNASYFLFFLLPIAAAVVSRRLLVPASLIAGCGLLFSSLPYHGQTFGYAPAFIWSQGTALVALRLRGELNRACLAAAAALGAVAAYLEPMSGGMVIGSGLLFLITFLENGNKTIERAFRDSTLLLCGYALGFGGSILFKQLLALMLFGWDKSFGIFFSQMFWRIGVTGQTVTLWDALAAIINHTKLLTFGSVLLSDLLLYGSGIVIVAGLAAATFEMYTKQSLRREQALTYLGILVPAFIVLLWYSIFTSHTQIHAWILVRLMYIPFAVAFLFAFTAAQRLWFPESSKELLARILQSGVAGIAVPRPDGSAIEAIYSRTHLNESAAVLSHIDAAACEAMVEKLRTVRELGGRLFILGVGGSAANASHAVNDFRKICAIEAYAPTDNVSELTARTNDEGWATVFIEWLRTSRLSSKDAVLVFSVGGGSIEPSVSPNIVNALKLAVDRKAAILGIIGRDGGYTATVADACVRIPTVNPTNVTPHAEAFQSIVWHLIVSHPRLKITATKWESVLPSAGRELKPPKKLKARV